MYDFMGINFPTIKCKREQHKINNILHGELNIT